MYAAMLNHPARAPHVHARGLHLGRRGLAGRAHARVPACRRFGCQILEGYGLSETSPVACFNRSDHERTPGSIGAANRGRRAPRRTRRRAADPRSQRHEGLLEPPRRDRGRDRRRRLVPLGRHRPRRRRRVLLHRRPQEGRRHPRRLQRLPARDRGGPLRASGRARSRRARHPARRRSARMSAPRSR